MAAPDHALLHWVVDHASPGSVVHEVTGLRGGDSPWLIRLAGVGPIDVVLRLGDHTDAALLATEVAALQAAAGHGVPAPTLIAADLDASVSPGVLAVLTTRVPGSSHVTGEPTATRLRAQGTAVAMIHATPKPMSMSTALPHRDRPINGVDFGALRRSAPARPLLLEAEQLLTALPVPDRPTVFVHGDFWHGNTLWEGDELTGVVDWDSAGIGQPGIDLGSMRCDAAVISGLDAADEVLVGYEAAVGHRADDVPYWDVVAALSTPPTMEWFVDAIQDQGRTDLDQATLLERRDAFLAAAITRLP